MWMDCDVKSLNSYSNGYKVENMKIHSRLNIFYLSYSFQVDINTGAAEYSATDVKCINVDISFQNVQQHTPNKFSCDLCEWNLRFFNFSFSIFLFFVIKFMDAIVTNGFQDSFWFSETHKNRKKRIEKR